MSRDTTPSELECIGLCATRNAALPIPYRRSNGVTVVVSLITSHVFDSADIRFPRFHTLCANVDSKGRKCNRPKYEHEHHLTTSAYSGWSMSAALRAELSLALHEMRQSASAAQSCGCAVKNEYGTVSQCQYCEANWSAYSHWRMVVKVLLRIHNFGIGRYGEESGTRPSMYEYEM